jgi:hypothetical protein
MPVRASSEADLTRGGAQPSSEANLTQGGVQPSSEADLARWGPIVQVGCGGNWGCDYVVCVLGLRFSLRLRFLRNEMGFPRLFRGPLWLSPTTPARPIF